MDIIAQNNSHFKAFMGCVESTPTVNRDSNKQLNTVGNMFVVQGIIGTGGFGKVLAVTLQQTGKWYAVKEVNKVSHPNINMGANIIYFCKRDPILIQVDLVKHKTGHSMIFSELDAMSRVEQHPFLISLHLAYHDRFALLIKSHMLRVVLTYF